MVQNLSRGELMEEMGLPLSCCMLFLVRKWAVLAYIPVSCNRLMDYI